MKKLKAFLKKLVPLLIIILFMLVLLMCQSSSAPQYRVAYRPLDDVGAPPPPPPPPPHTGSRGEPEDDEGEYYYYEEEASLEPYEDGEHMTLEEYERLLEELASAVPRTAPYPSETTVSAPDPEFDRQAAAMAYVEAVNALREGNVVYPARQEMQQARVEQVSVRVYMPGVAPERRAWVEEEVIEAVSLSQVMCADLIDPYGVFRLSRGTERCQVVVGEYTEWLWMVFPRTSGRFPLNLSITNEIEVDGDEKYRTVLAKEATIEVDIDVVYCVKLFLTDNWKWILMGFGGIAGVFGGCSAWYKRRFGQKSRGAGF